jgi:hypothetical protein
MKNYCNKCGQEIINSSHVCFNNTDPANWVFSCSRDRYILEIKNLLLDKEFLIYKIKTEEEKHLDCELKQLNEQIEALLSYI